MNYKMICRFFSLICFLMTVFLLPPIGISIYDGEMGALLGFSVAAAVSCGLFVTFKLVSRNTTGTLYAKEGFVCVAASWLLMSLIGSIPLILSGAFSSYIDALFEIVSGFTTTGASVCADVEALSRPINYWRCFSHWVGGMGVLVFLLALVPGSKKNEGFTMHLFRAESPGPEVGKLVPKLRQTAAVLYTTYILLTVANFIFLVLGDMDVFEAVCTALGTAGTGGFGIKNDSLAGFSPYIQTVTTVFMLLFAVNFSCYYLMFLRQFKSVVRDQELRLYLCIVVGAVALITWNVFSATQMYATVGETVHHAAFQVASIISTSGFSTTDFNLWPAFSKVVLIFLMITGACAGSTCGGMKCARVLLLFKGLRRNIRRMLHPSRVEVIRVNGNAVDERVMANTNAYLSAYVIILFVSFLLISLDSYPAAASGFSAIETNFTATLACFNNIGPGFGAVGPMENFGGYGIFSKIVLIFDMLAGRLEIFPMLLLFSPGVWKRR